MLMLSRKKFESIRIADDIYITVVSVRGGIVRLGIEAPRDVEVMRTEIDEENGRESKQKQRLTEQDT